MAKKKKAEEHGGHGWFVTFADLMALLMSFFVMVAAYSSQEREKFNQVAGAFRDAFGTQKEFRYSGIVEADGIPTRPRLKNVRHAPYEEASDFTIPNELSSKDSGVSNAGVNKGFGLAAASLRQALQDMPEIAELSKNIIVEETKDGLNISLVDQDGRSMFPDGSINPYERTRRVLERMAPVIRRMPNRVAITGHTSASRPGSRPGWSSWEISSGRAAAVREILAVSGVPDDRFSAITGKADTDPMFPDNPYLPSNRRVSILLLKEAPPMPFGSRP